MAKLKIGYLLLKYGTYYYGRRISSDLKSHVDPKQFILVNLNTRDPLEAASRIPDLAAQDDALFQNLRLHSSQGRDITVWDRPMFDPTVPSVPFDIPPPPPAPTISPWDLSEISCEGVEDSNSDL